MVESITAAPRLTLVGRRPGTDDDFQTGRFRAVIPSRHFGEVEIVFDYPWLRAQDGGLDLGHSVLRELGAALGHLGEGLIHSSDHRDPIVFDEEPA